MQRRLYKTSKQAQDEDPTARIFRGFDTIDRLLDECELDLLIGYGQTTSINSGRVNKRLTFDQELEQLIRSIRSSRINKREFYLQLLIL